MNEIVDLRRTRVAEAAACLYESPLLGTRPTREQIERLERILLQGPQVDLPMKHYFAPGIYAREMFIPAGTVLTGDVHKTEHIATFVGDITVWTDDGMKRLIGHHTFSSKAGAKRVGYAHSDTYCTGYFPNPDEERDVRVLEERLCENPTLLLCNRTDIQFEGRPCLE